MPLRHTGRSPRATGRAVDRLISIKYRVTGSGLRRNGFARPQNMRTAIYCSVFGVNKRVLLIYPLPYYPAPRDQLVGGVIFEPLKIFLRINNGIKITAITYVDGQRT